MGAKGLTPHYELPGRISENPGDQLRSFGITEIPGARVNTTDPAVSQAQQMMAGAELRRRRKGMRPQAMKDMGEAKLREYAGTPRKGLPKRKG